MRDLTQKIGYLKGLRDSLGADPNEPTNRITNLMIDVLNGLTETVDELINEPSGTERLRRFHRRRPCRPRSPQ